LIYAVFVGGLPLGLPYKNEKSSPEFKKSSPVNNIQIYNKKLIINLAIAHLIDLAIAHSQKMEEIK